MVLGFSEHQAVTTRDRSSGRFHQRFPLNRRLLVDERCNLDAAGAYDVMPRGGRADRGDGIPVGTEEGLLCKYCFGAPDEESDEENKDRV